MFQLNTTIPDDNLDLFLSTEQIANKQRIYRSGPFVKFIMTKRISRFLIFIFLLMICLAIFGGLYLIIRTTPVEDTNKDNNLLSNQTILIINNELLENYERSTLETLQHPTKFVIISHTATNSCYNIEQCLKIIASIHIYHISNRNTSIIGYNFLIGNDGNIYEGRGWDFINFYRNNSIAISFIGNYINDELTQKAIDAVQYLLQKGVELGKLSKDYLLICHNQTQPTLSPGLNVYKIVKTWRHFTGEKFYSDNSF